MGGIGVLAYLLFEGQESGFARPFAQRIYINFSLRIRGWRGWEGSYGHLQNSAEGVLEPHKNHLGGPGTLQVERRWGDLFCAKYLIYLKC